METVAAPHIPDHEILRQIGHGSYGEVWLARNLTTRAYRAIKVVRRKAFEHDRPYEREFHGLQKFEPLSRSHEGLMDVLHVGQDDAEELFYAVMELADDQHSGQEIAPETYAPRTLRGEIRIRGRLPFGECLQLGISLASALGHLHQHGLVHRDIKPSNIIFVNGVPKLADIGLVTDRDATCSFVGTEGYVPREGPGTPAADLFALGKVLYEICTGRDRLDYPELPTALKDYPDRAAVAALNEVILRACDPDPRNRYQSAEEMQNDLLRLQRGEPLAKRLPLRQIKVWTTGVVAMLAVLVLVAPSKPKLRLIREAKSLALSASSTPLRGDWNGNGAQDLFVLRDGRLQILGPDGTLLDEWEPPAKNAHDLNLQLVTPVDVGGPAEAFAGWREGETNVLASLKCGPQRKAVTHLSFKVKGAERIASPSTVTGTSLNARKVVELEQNGKHQLLATLSSGYGELPRGLYCFSLETSAVLWSYPTGPNVGDIVCMDLEGDNRMDVIFGSYAPDNGNRGPDGTDDSHSYVYALSPNGLLLWTNRLWDQLSLAHLLVVRTNRQGAQCVCAWVGFSGIDYREQEGKPEIGQIVRLDGAGKIKATIELGSYILSCVAEDIDFDDQQELIATTSAGDIWVLSPDLKCKRKLHLGAKGKRELRLELLAIGDLNGDGRPELVCRSYRHELRSPLNPGFLDKPSTVHVELDDRLCILDAELHWLADYRLMAVWTNPNPGISATIGDFEHTGRNQILVQADKTYTFELRPRRFPVFW